MRHDDQKQAVRETGAGSVGRFVLQYIVPTQDGLPVATVTLSDSTFESVGTPDKVRYWPKAGSLGTWFDEYGLGNPAFYKTYFFGFNDSCPTARLDIADIIDKLPGLPGSDGVKFDAANQAVQNFRENSVVNTYAETDLFTDPVPILSEFDIGVSYINTRVVDFRPCSDC